MICYEILASVHASILTPDESFDMLALTETQDFNDFDGQTFEVLEVRKDIDGTPMPQFGLTEDLGALMADEEKAPAIREALNQGGANVAEATFVRVSDFLCAGAWFTSSPRIGRGKPRLVG